MSYWIYLRRKHRNIFRSSTPRERRWLKSLLVENTGLCNMHKPWWRNQMETFSALLASCAWNSPVPGEFPTQRPVTRNLDVFFDLRPNKRLSKQWWGWWFVTPSCPWWVIVMSNAIIVAGSSCCTRVYLNKFKQYHYNDVIMTTIASQITSLTVAYSTVYSDADQRKHQSSASLAFVRGIHRGPVNCPHKWPVTRKRFPSDDVIMSCLRMPGDDRSSGDGRSQTIVRHEIYSCRSCTCFHINIDERCQCEWSNLCYR